MAFKKYRSIFMLSICTLLLGTVGCRKRDFGYKDNPAQALVQSYYAVTGLNEEKAMEWMGGEALCLYGRIAEMERLKGILPDFWKLRKYKMEAVELKTKVLRTPQFVGYWSYYSESYRVNIIEKKSKELLLEADIVCHFGVKGARNPTLPDLNPMTFPEKHCKVIKIDPHAFHAPAPRSECNTPTEQRRTNRRRR